MRQFFMKQFLKKKLLFVLLITLSSGFMLSCSKEEAVSLPLEPDFWPTTYWKSSTPEAQNMDSDKLREMFAAIETSGLEVHSVLIIKNGHMVTESYLYPYTKNDPHSLNSVTKNITSALIGIAMEDGYIENVDQKIIEIFPDIHRDRNIEDFDEQKQSITVENLLTMETGLGWNDWEYLGEMTDKNQVEDILGNRMISEPGEKFHYNSGASHILSAMIHEATGKSSLEFAREKIFEPLGISGVAWRTDGDGINIGGTQLFMRPGDLAKFGYLYLNQGKWEGRQIIPEKWVSASTKAHTSESYNVDYGYQWWLIDYLDGYFGNGFGGQMLYVDPTEDLIVVFTAGTPADQDYRVFTKLIKDYILSAISEEAISGENPKAFTQLVRQIGNLASPPEPSSVDLPEIALEISNNSYEFENGEVLRFKFTEDKDEAVMSWTQQDGEKNEYSIGLDGQYRMNPNFPLYDEFSTDLALRGSWEDDRTLILDYVPIGFSTTHQWKLHFEDSGLHLEKTVLSTNRVFFDETAEVREE